MINSREQVMHTIHTWNGGQKGIKGTKGDDGDDYRKDGYEKNANDCNGGRTGASAGYPPLSRIGI